MDTAVALLEADSDTIMTAVDMILAMELTAASVPAAGPKTARVQAQARTVSQQRKRPRVLKRVRIGVTRRLRCLAWMGHGPAEVADYIGEDVTEVERWLRGSPVAPYVLDVCERVFEDLCMTFGPNRTMAAYARAEGWPPPLAWYDINIDKSDAQPHVNVPLKARRKPVPLGSQVMLALIGRIGVDDLIPEEKNRAVRILHYNCGWSDRRISAWLRWNPDGDHDKGRFAVYRFRLRHDIKGGGPELHKWGGNHDDDDFIVTPAAA